MNAVEVTQFRKTYRVFRKTVEAVRGISFRVPAGQLVGFVGPNGAGKSTTLKSILGFLQPTAGLLRVYGQPAGSDAALRHIGFMPEHPAFPDTLTGFEWVDYAHRLHTGHRPERSHVDRLMESVGLAHASHRLIRGYSKGMLQRLGLAQALVAQPDILILDEPMSGLDPLGRVVFKDILQQYHREGHTIFFTSHILDDVENLCSRIILIDRGEVAVDEQTHILLDTASDRKVLHFTAPETLARALVTEGYALSVSAGEVYELAGLDAAAASALVARLVAAGATIRELRRERLTLEDFFVQLVTRGGAVPHAPAD